MDRMLTVSQTLKAYCAPLDATDYFSRAIELWQCCRIYSDTNNKVFFTEYVSLCCQVFIDAQLCEEYLVSNRLCSISEDNEAHIVEEEQAEPKRHKLVLTQAEAEFESERESKSRHSKNLSGSMTGYEFVRSNSGIPMSNQIPFGINGGLYDHESMLQYTYCMYIVYVLYVQCYSTTKKYYGLIVFFLLIKAQKMIQVNMHLECAVPQWWKRMQGWSRRCDL